MNYKILYSGMCYLIDKVFRIDKIDLFVIFFKISTHHFFTHQKSSHVFQLLLIVSWKKMSFSSKVRFLFVCFLILFYYKKSSSLLHFLIRLFLQEWKNLEYVLWNIFLKQKYLAESWWFQPKPRTSHFSF